MPIKRDPSLIPLSHDHHHGLVRVFEIRKALKSDDGIELQYDINLRFLREELQPHFVAEEDHLFPALREAIDSKQVDLLIHEHRQLEELANQRDITDLEAFANLLEDHIRKEEREVFQQYQASVAAGERERIGRAIKHALGR